MTGKSIYPLSRRVFIHMSHQILSDLKLLLHLFMWKSNCPPYTCLCWKWMDSQAPIKGMFTHRISVKIWLNSASHWFQWEICVHLEFFLMRDVEKRKIIMASLKRNHFWVLIPCWVVDTCISPIEMEIIRIQNSSENRRCKMKIRNTRWHEGITVWKIWRVNIPQGSTNLHMQISVAPSHPILPSDKVA